MFYHYFTSTMAQQRLGLAAVLLVLKTISVFTSSSPSALQSDHNGGSPLGIKFYKDCEIEIRQALENFSDSELANEVKLTRVKKSNGTNFFYPFEEVLAEKHYFTWKPQKNEKRLESSATSLVIRLSSLANKSSSVWMASTFIALKRCNISSNPEQTHYYAMVVYARKDADGIHLEWDRWSPSIGKALEGRQAFENALDHMMVITRGSMLCAYGTCSCVACNNCPGVASNEEPEDENEVHKGLVSDISAEINKYNNLNARDAKIMFGKKQSPKSAKTNAHSTAAVTGEKSHAKANSYANSHRGTAMAESVSDGHGDSVAVAKGRINSVSDAKSSDGVARALSVTNRGFAQSSSQSSLGGTVESVAGKTGQGEKDYDSYDDIEMDNGDEEFDAEALFKETDQTFELADKRIHFTKLTAKGDISSGMCSRELEMIKKMNSLELTAILKESNNSNKSMKRSTVLLMAPLRFGIDVDSGVNKSIILVSETSGFTVKYENCCQLKSENTSTAVMQLLDGFEHSCDGSLQDVVGRLEKFDFTQIKKLMQIKIISLLQNRDLVPMLILRNFLSLDSDKLQDSILTIQNMFNNATSRKVTTSTAIIINIAHFATVKGMHKIKIFKELANNAQSVWTGVLLEYKKCVGVDLDDNNKTSTNSFVKEKCQEKYADKLVSELNLALGTCLFLKYADARFSTMNNSEENPVQTFVNFMQLHNLNIAKQVYCKTRRLALKLQ